MTDTAAYRCALCDGPISVADNANGGLITVNMDGHGKAAHRVCPTATAARLPRAKCRACDRVVAVNIPSRGDGTVDVFRNHRTPEGGRCAGGRREVRQEDYTDA